MSTHVHYRPGEPLVGHGRHCDQQLAIKKATGNGVFGPDLAHPPASFRSSQLNYPGGPVEDENSPRTSLYVHSARLEKGLPCDLSWTISHATPMAREARLMSMVRSYAFKAAAVCLALCAQGVCAEANELASAWSEGKRESKARLVAGSVSGQSMAAVEIVLSEGWKTYWRVPGDAGGVPPVFNWSKSQNVASAKVLYPVPTRFADKDGDTLGFKGSAIFPVVVTPKDATQQVDLVLVLEYGICREICIPVEAELTVSIPAGDTGPLPAAVTAALDRVPRAAGARRSNDPILTKTELRLDGPHPSIAIEAVFPGGTANAAVYVESAGGDYIPLPKLGSGKAAGTDTLRFEIDLTGAVDPADIRGKDAKVTLVSALGLTEATFKFE